MRYKILKLKDLLTTAFTNLSDIEDLTNLSNTEFIEEIKDLDKTDLEYIIDDLKEALQLMKDFEE